MTLIPNFFCSSRASSRVETPSSGANPINIRNSVSFGIIKSMVPSISSGRGEAGAGFRIVLTPYFRPSAIASAAASTGISSTDRTTSLRAMMDCAFITNWRSMSLFAPMSRMMPFLPCGLTIIKPTPVDAAVVSIKYSALTPSSSYRVRAISPRRSDPIRPTKWDSAPSRAAATAWFDPLPPGPMSNREPIKVSPNIGIR